MNEKPDNVQKFRFFPEPVSNIIGKITQPALKKNGLETGLLKDWNQMVGPQLAAYCQPLKLHIPRSKKSGVLTVEVQASHALVAQHLQSLILEKLNVYYGYRAVERVQFKQVTPPPQAMVMDAIAPERKAMADKLHALYTSLLH